MFTKTQSLYSKYNFEYLEIEDIINLIKTGNENTSLVNTLRSLEYKSNEYNIIKEQLTSCIMMHGKFTSLKDSSIKSLSNYLFYDIDNVGDIESVKKSLIDLGVNIIYKSVGGNGLHLLVKCEGLTIDNFKQVYNIVFKQLINLGFDIDKSAKGLSRRPYLSTDENIYVGNDTFITILGDEVSVGNDTFSLVNNSSNDLICGGQSKGLKTERYKGNDTFSNLELIPINQLLKDIKLKTQFEVKEDVLINEMEWVDILIPKKIKDGLKHTVYRRIMFQLSYLNNNITPNQIYSYLYYINKERTDEKMSDKVLRKLVINTINYIENNNITIKMRNKKIHLNDDYTPKQKEELGGKINAIIRENESIKKIKEARSKLKLENEKQTRVKVSEMTGLSLITVKRNWDKEERNINDIIPERVDDKEIERDYKLSQLTELDEDNWFNNWEPKKVSVDKSIEDEDFGEADGIDGFIESIDI
jgi:hypothetical protein